MPIPRVWWPDAHGDGPLDITGDAAHHLSRVLRIAPGDSVGVFDGRGREWAGRVDRVSKQSVLLTGLVSVTPVTEARVPVTLAVGILKGDQMDAVVRDATMLGVAAIAPMQTEHVTVPTKAWQSGAARDRWTRVAVASATQCRRAVVPPVHAVADLDSCLRESFAMRLICVEPSANTGQSADAEGWRSAPAPASLQLLIGPEGGWAPDEIALARSAGARLMGLGPRTLRAETAPGVALTLVAAAWGW